MINVVFFDCKPYDRTSFEAVNRDFGLQITFYEMRLTPNSAPLAKGADVVCAFVNDDISAETIDTLCANGVKLLAMRCAGYNNVDLPAAYGRLNVVRVPEYSPYAVAEYTLALLLCLNRCLHRAFNRVREHNFSINGLLGFDLHGKTVGIIGTGKIGRIFAKLMSGFGVRLLAVDPFPHPEAQELGVEYVSLETLYTESHIISLHCPLTQDNRHFINAEALARMKPGVILLNTSRGALIDTQALIEALKNGRVGAAGLDVYEEETDYFFEDRSGTAIQDDVLARLLTFPNVIITSHQAFFTREAIQNIAVTTLTNIQNYFIDGTLKNGICNLCAGGKCPNCKKIQPEKK